MVGVAPALVNERSYASRVLGSTLGGLGRLRLAPRRGSHEDDHRIPDGFLYRISGRAIERHRVDDRLHNDAVIHQMADRRRRVIIISAEPIDPSDDDLISGPHLVEQPPRPRGRPATLPAGDARPR
jgi:hypothetical protein